MTDVIFGGAICTTKVGRILGGERTALRETPYSIVRNFVQGMTVGVVQLHQSTAPGVELMSKRSDKPVIVGDRSRSPLFHLAEAGITARKNRRSSALTRRQRPKTIGIGIWVSD